MHKPSLPRINKIIRRQTLINFFVYMIIGVFGFVSQLSMISPISIERNSPSGGTDWPALIAVAGITISLIAGFPTNVLPFKQAFFIKILGVDKASRKQSIALAFCLLTLTTTVSIILPNITSALGLLGGLLVIQMSFFLPCVIQIKLSDKPWYAAENLVVILFFGTLCIMGYLSAIITVIQTAKGWTIMPRWLPDYGDK